MHRAIQECWTRYWFSASREIVNNCPTSVIDKVSLALFCQDNALRLQREYDFNKELLDTIQALVVTSRPCGTILSFNRQTENVTGYTEEEPICKYWVDVLILRY